MGMFDVIDDEEDGGVNGQGDGEDGWVSAPTAGGELIRDYQGVDPPRDPLAPEVEQEHGGGGRGSWDAEDAAGPWRRPRQTKRLFHRRGCDRQV